MFVGDLMFIFCLFLASKHRNLDRRFDFEVLYLVEMYSSLGPRYLEGKVRSCDSWVYEI